MKQKRIVRTSIAILFLMVISLSFLPQKSVSAHSGEGILKTLSPHSHPNTLDNTLSQYSINPQQSKPKAYVLTGDVEGQTTAASNTALEAKSDYEEAGYDVVFINEASKQDVINALNDPDAKALWIVGHGKYDSVAGKTGKEKLTNPVEMIDMKDAYIEGSDFTPKPNIKQVTFHSCGQDLKSWRDLFPNADFRSWESTTRSWQYYWWQWFNEYDPVTSDASISMPKVNPVLEQEGQFYFEPTAGKYVANMSYLANDFPLHEPLKSQFGSQAVNFYTVDTNTGDRQILFGADIADGKIGSSYVNGTAIPTFDVSVANEALYQILEYPSTIWNAYAAGYLQITPYVPVDKDVLFKGMAMLFFGQTEGGVGGIVVPIDRFGLLAPYIGLASTTLAATVATAIYVKRVKRRKEKQ
ncbi:hypothetical protein MUP79_01435 [Candidatus Bathyarchaeota archaeon]|nr:hypothetical protein [Candidatus Bathyarchaeota archaeon]